MKEYIQKNFKIRELHAAGKPSEMTFESFKDAIKELYRKYFTEEYLKKNLVFPDELKTYCSCVETNFYDENDFEAWYSVASIVASTEDFCQRFESEFLERKEQGQLGSTDKIWLSLGWWSDKHEYLYCCDKSSEFQGKLLDVNDDHPWIGGDSLLYETNDTLYNYFKNYVEDFERRNAKEETEQKHFDAWLSKQELPEAVSVLELLRKYESDRQKEN